MALTDSEILGAIGIPGMHPYAVCRARRLFPQFGCADIKGLGKFVPGVSTFCTAVFGVP